MAIGRPIEPPALRFPEVVPFPNTQRLTLNGAFEDYTLPAPYVTDEKERGVIADTGVEDEDLLPFEGICNENSPQFRRTTTVEAMMAIDPDNASHEAESSEGEHNEPDEIGGAPDQYLDTF